MQPIPPPRRVSPLTPRQREVLQHLVEGKSYKQIGLLIHISHNTVRSHVRNAEVCLHAKTRDQAIARAAVLGYVIVPM